MTTPRTGFLPALGVGLVVCLWAMPAAADTVVRAEPTAGETLLSFHSEVLDEERSLLVRLPEGYATSNRRYPVLFLLDAEYFFSQATAALQFLSECGYARNQPLPQLIVVGIVNVDRDRDYTPTHRPEWGTLRFPTSGHAGRFLDFLEQELIPLVDRRYRTHSHRILAGWSFGGLFTVHTLLHRPQLFSAYLAVSPSLWWDDGVEVERAQRLFRDGGSIVPRLVLTLGSAESGDMGESVRHGFVPLLRKQPPGRVSFQYVEIPDEGHGYVPFKAWFEGLRALYPDWVIPATVIEAGEAAVLAFYGRLSESYGYEVEIPESICITMAESARRRGEESRALELARGCTRSYPQSVHAQLSLGAVHQERDELELARDRYLEALELVNARSVPFSELAKSVTRRLDDVERELAAKAVE